VLTVSFVGDLRSVLREPHFGQLYATRLTAQCADGIFQVALAGYVLFSPEKQTTAAKAAASFATVLLPYSLVGPFAGVLIDRWSRQRILQLGNLVRALLVCVVALVVATGSSGIAFYVAALSVLSVNRFFLSSLSAALPHVVRPQQLVMANSVSTTSGTLVAILGGGLGFGVRKLVGEDDLGSATVLITAALVYVASSSVARRMAVDLLGPDDEVDRPEAMDAVKRVARGLVDGAQHVWHHRRAGYALAAIGAHRFFYGLSTVATFLLYRNYFTDDGWLKAGLGGLGQVFVASALGVFVAAAITPGMTRRIGAESWIVVCYASAAVAELAFGLPYTQTSFLFAAFFLGVAAQASKICVDTILQTTIDDRYRGRVFSFYDVLFNVAFVSAAVVGAYTLPDSGKSYAVVLTIAVGYAVTSIAYRLAVPPEAPAVVIPLAEV
jgi:MFS family permease